MAKDKIKVGLLPLYLKLYDDTMANRRPRIEAFYKQIAGELEKRSLGVLTSPICRVKSEFDAAVKSFEAGGAEAIVTLHLAYSPSLESAEALARSRLPVIVCDTTPTYAYGPDQDPEELMYNHGIHGVQDMCNLLIRNGKSFQIEAGHWESSDVLDRVARDVLAARMAERMRTTRAGLIGEPFQGMGDFYVSAADLKRSIGIETRVLEQKAFKQLAASVTEEEIRKEQEEDRRRFVFENVSLQAHERSLRVDLAIQKWVDRERLSAFSFNFLNVDRASGFQTVPFLQASKLMARGVGYGGEGDILTAALVAALASGFPETSFTEMFCPDWKNGSIYLSHMGEFNYLLAVERPRLLEMDYRWSDTDNPVYVAGRFKPGEFLLVNLAPLPRGDYRLIIAPAVMLEVKGKDKMERSIRGWFKPRLSVEDFLVAYSKLGGTHHLALSYGATVETVEAFGRIMGWETAIIG